MAITQFNGLSNDLTQDAMENPEYLMTYAYTFAIFGILDCIALAIAFFLYMGGKGSCAVIIHALFMFVIVIIALSTMFLIASPTPAGTYLTDMTAILNGCTDEASAVPAGLGETESNALILISDKIPTFMSFILLGVFCNIIFGVILVLTECGCFKKGEEITTEINATD